MSRTRPSLARRPTLRAVALALTTASLVATGCSSDDDDDNDTHDHSDTEIDTRGRLVVYQPDNASASVLDLDESAAVIGTFAVAGEAPRLYPSPGNRYAALVQRTDGLVSFIDIGLYTEDHGDHLHDYAEDPTMLDANISGSRPTHFTPHEDHAAIFFDAEEGVASSVSLITDASIPDGETVGDLVLENNMHGVAKLIDDTLFVTYRDPSITETTLPDEVERYAFADGEFTFEHRYTEQCPGLHGSAATDSVLSFGCTDGVLLIDLEQDDKPATHLANPEALAEGSRFGSMYAHHDVDEHVAVGGGQFFAVSADDAVDPWLELALPEGVSNVAQGFSNDGSTFYVLGDNGDLHLFSTDAAWLMAEPVNVTTAVGEDDVSPVIAVSGSEDALYLLETGGQQIKVLDDTTGETLETLSLDATASSLLWLGLSHDEEHDHD